MISPRTQWFGSDYLVMTYGNSSAPARKYIAISSDGGNNFTISGINPEAGDMAITLEEYNSTRMLIVYNVNETLISSKWLKRNATGLIQGWAEIGSHSDGGHYFWNFSNISGMTLPQGNVNFRSRATDDVSNLWSDFFLLQANATLAGFTVTTTTTTTSTTTTTTTTTTTSSSTTTTTVLTPSGLATVSVAAKGVEFVVLLFMMSVVYAVITVKNEESSAGKYILAFILAILIIVAAVIIFAQ
jgi:hypothetical protein